MCMLWFSLSVRIHLNEPLVYHCHLGYNCLPFKKMKAAFNFVPKKGIPLVYVDVMLSKRISDRCDDSLSQLILTGD